MDAYLPLVTVIASGLFGLLVAVVTLALNGYKDSRAETRKLERDQRTKLEELYADHIALIEKCLRCTESRDAYSNLYDELARTNARMRLLSVPDVLDQSSLASDLLYQWSSEHRAGIPKPVGESGMAIISSHDTPHQKNAKEIYPKLQDQINEMIESMQQHLESLGQPKNAT